jgi:hypothetical protein
MAEETAAAEAPAPAPAQEGPSVAELQNTIEAERNARLNAEQAYAKANYYAQSAAAELSRSQAAPPPLGSLSEAILSDPAKADAEMQRRINEQVNQRMAMESQNLRAGLAAETMNQRTSNALASVQARYPELSDPVNSARFAGALTQAKFEADGQRVILTPEQLAERAAKIFRSINPPSAAAPAFVEGGARPNTAQMPADGQRRAEPTFLDAIYNAKPGDIVMEQDLKGFTKEFTRVQNAWRNKNGINTEKLEQAQ